jgi:hypothetical protein
MVKAGWNEQKDMVHAGKRHGQLIWSAVKRCDVSLSLRQSEGRVSFKSLSFFFLSRRGWSQVTNTLATRCTSCFGSHSLEHHGLRYRAF